MSDSFAEYNRRQARIQRAEWLRRVRNGLLLFMLGALFSLGLVWLGIYAAEREAAGQEELRRERCARWGENLPRDLEGYCADLGV